MTAQTAATSITSTGAFPGSRVQQRVHFIVFLVLGLAVIIFGSNYFDIFPTNRNPVYNGILAGGLLAAALWLRRSSKLQRYWQIAYTFFIASMVNLVASLENNSSTILGWFNLNISSSAGQAVDKLYEVLMVVGIILVLTLLSGARLSSIFLQRGSLKLGLAIGALVIFNMLASAFLFHGTRFASLGSLGAGVGWGLVFSLANGFSEELWLRGIFLKRLQPFLGAAGSIWLTSILFSLMHGGALYLQPAAVPFMVANTLTLGLGCAWLMMKTDNVWGAALIHAGADWYLFIALLASA